MKFEQIIARGLELGLEAVEIYASTSESNTIKVTLKLLTMTQWKFYSNNY